jgi:hypothetical protein
VVGAVATLAMALVAVWLAMTDGGGTRPTASSLARPGPLASGTAAPARPLDSAKAAAAPATSFVHFSNGMFQVGPDIRPGTYRTRTGSNGCYFARLKGFSGSLDDVLANDNPQGPAVVTILATDRGFQSDACATWTADLSPLVKGSSFGPGDYIVGTDLEPGTYRDSGPGQSCYYARLSGFTHALSDVIANNNTTSPAIVTVAPSDRGFTSAGCGAWTRIG